MLFTFPPDPRKRPTAAAVVKEFKDKGIDPEGYVLYTYAAFQVWAQAAAKAGTTDPQKVAAAMRAGTWDTVLGPIAYDKKGDITGGGWAVYRWNKDGNYQEITESGPQLKAPDRLTAGQMASLPSCGNASISQLPRSVIQPEKNATPATINSPPIAFSTTLR